MIQYNGVGPSWLVPGIFLALFVVSGVFGGIAGRSFEPRIARLQGAIQSTLLYVVPAAIGLIGVGALLWLYLGPVILGGE